jgi:phage portal protein BeeE
MLSLAKKSGRPNGIISAQGIGSVDIAQTFVDRITRYFGPAGSGGLMPVDLGQLYFTKLSFSPEELQQDATYSRTVTQIASAFRVQPSRVMHAITDHNNASLYSSNATHVQDCVQPWTKRAKPAVDKEELGKKRREQGYYTDIALQGLLQGAPEERGKLYMALRTVGAMSPLTVAQLEELPTANVSDDPSFPLLTNPNPDQGNSGDEGNA